MQLSSTLEKDLIDSIIDTKDYIWIFNAELSLFNFSDAVLELTNKKRKELEGLTLQGFLSENKNRGSITAYKKVLHSGIPFRVNYFIESNHGEDKKFMELLAYKMGKDLVVNEKDVTELYRSNLDIDPYEQNLRLISKHTNGYSLIIDKLGTILFIDKLMPGFTMEDVVGSSVFDYQNGEDTIMMKRCINNVLSTGLYDDYELTYKTPEKEFIAFEGRVVPLFENGEITSLAITSTDISKRKKTEFALEETQIYISTLLEKTGSLFSTHDLNLRFTSIRHHFSSFDAMGIIGKTDKELFPPDHPEVDDLIAFKKSVLDDGKTRRRDIRITLKGIPRYYDVIVEPILDHEGTIAGISCIAIDITERKKREDALIKSEKKLIEAQKIAHIGYYGVDLSKRKLECGQETFKIFGIDRKDVEPSIEEYRTFIHKEDAKKVGEETTKTITEGVPFSLEYRIVRRDNTIRHIRSRADIIKNEAGQVIKIFGAIQDITEEQQAKKELKNKEEFIQKIAGTNPSIIYILDMEKQQSVFASQAVGETLGYSVEEYIEEQNRAFGMFSELEEGELLVDNTTIVHSDDLGSLAKIYFGINQSKEDELYELEYRVKNKQGQWKWMSDRIVPFQRNEEGQSIQVLGISRDITNKKKTDAEARNAMIVEQEKERKRIAADLHDAINPLLSAAKLNVESFKEKYGETDELGPVNLNNAIHLLEQTMKEIRDISANLMPGVLVDFGLEEALKDLCKRISESKSLQINWSCHGLINRLDQKTEVTLFRIGQELLNNIIKHADATFVNVQLVQHKNSLVLMIDDDGKGFDPSEEKILENRSGFRNVNSRVQFLEGKMDIDSLQGRGTTITVEIPIA